jgi:prophage regulatory protein
MSTINHYGGNKLIRLPAVIDMTGISRAHIFRLIKAAKFPRSVATGPNSRAWVLSEIQSWVADRIAARDDGSDAELRGVQQTSAAQAARKRKLELQREAA